MSRRFINDGSKQLGRQFSDALLDHEKTADIYKNYNKNHEYPVLETICYYASENTDSDLLSDVNSVLKKKKLDGFTLLEEDLHFITFQDKELNGKLKFYST